MLQRAVVWCGVMCCDVVCCDVMWCAVVQVWSFSQFQAYLTEHLGEVPDNWVDTTLKVGGAGSVGGAE